MTLLSDLAIAGFPVESVDQLRMSGKRYSAAIPVLLTWLPLTTDLLEKESIVRALSVPWAKTEALGPLLSLFRAGPTPGTSSEELVRWAVGNALEVLYDDKEFDSVTELVLERKFGTARQMVALALGKSKKLEAVDVLLRIIDDPDVEGHVVSALGKLKAPTAKSALESKLDHPMTWIRKAAQRGLARLP